MRASQAIWQAMADDGDLYLDRYEGWYSVRDEAYYEEKELTDGEGGAKLSPQGTPVEWTAEESWFFRLSKYQQPLLDLYAANPDFIRPEQRRNEIVRFVEGGLVDLSVSRTSFDWGVPVPGRHDHVMYVWVDALTNYHHRRRAIPTTAELSRNYWPADHPPDRQGHRPLPRGLLAGFPDVGELAAAEARCSATASCSTAARRCRSRSAMSSIRCSSAELYGVDALRYFLLRDVSFGNDGTFSDEAIVTRANADLSNSFGNLAQRVLAFIAKNCEGHVPEGKADEADAVLLAEVDVAGAAFRVAFDDLALSRGVEAWMTGVFACNQYIDAQAPWALRKTDPERMNAVLRTLLRAIRRLATTILPVIPTSAGKLLLQLPSEDDEDYRIAPPTPIFPRLELQATEA